MRKRAGGRVKDDNQERREASERWQLEMGLRIDRLVRFADEYEDLLAMLVEREKERRDFRKAVMEKTLGALILTGVLGLLSLVWAGLGMEIRNIVNAVRGK